MAAFLIVLSWQLSSKRIRKIKHRIYYKTESFLKMDFKEGVNNMEYLNHLLPKDKLNIGTIKKLKRFFCEELIFLFQTT